MTDKIKIGLDIHGVIDKLPEVFSFLSKSIIKNDGEVHIITGGSWNDDIIEKLKKYDIKYTHSFSIYDYMMDNNFEHSNEEITFPDGTKQKKFNSREWDKIKGYYCKENNISLHIDDRENYSKNFSTPFSLLLK